MKTNELKSAMQKIVKVIDADSMISGSDCVIFSNEDIMAFNDTIGISCLVSDTGIKCAVKAKDFYKVISTIKESEVSLTVKDDKLFMNSESTEAEFALYPFETTLKIINTILIDELNSKTLPSNFLDGVKLCFSTVTDDFGSNLSLFAMKFENDCLYSANPFKVCKYKMCDSIESEFLLYKATAKALLKFKPLTFAENNGWVIFENEDNDFLFGRKVEGDFPNLNEIIAQFPDVSKAVKLPCDDMRETVKKFIELHDAKEGYNKHILVTIKDGYISLNLQKESMVVKQKFSIEEKDIDTTISISAVFLYDVLEITDTLLVSETMVKFQDENFTHLIMLGKL